MNYSVILIGTSLQEFLKVCIDDQQDQQDSGDQLHPVPSVRSVVMRSVMQVG